MSRSTVFRLVKLSAFLVLVMLWASAAPIDARVEIDNGIVRVKSAVPMAEAITRIKADIAAKGIKFFSEIDQSKLAADAGIKLRPSTLLVFGNPPLGTQFITAESGCRARLAGATVADPGRQWRRLGDLDRFRLDRASSQHHRPLCAVQDGNLGRRLDHLDDRARMSAVRRNDPNRG